ncbi:hypothetical protein PI124_g8657 [Phytophthora idaei]|nr:hypothetical protein PI125_g18738 [Phytophthora idaei]KAG3138443.1 hypothetical protein PI126_g16912 [Phytophthora idaei]KAG3246613.1 hypothetical protein PI124_g8657 [Phytophthora idaei]
MQTEPSVPETLRVVFLRLGFLDVTTALLPRILLALAETLQSVRRGLPVRVSIGGQRGVDEARPLDFFLFIEIGELLLCEVF